MLFNQYLNIRGRIKRCLCAKESSRSYNLWKNIDIRSHKGTCLVLPLPFGPIARLETVSNFRMQLLIKANIWTCFKCYSRGKPFSFYYSNFRAISLDIFSQHYWDVTTASVSFSFLTLLLYVYRKILSCTGRSETCALCHCLFLYLYICIF